MAEGKIENSFWEDNGLYCNLRSSQIEAQMRKRDESGGTCTP